MLEALYKGNVLITGTDSGNTSNKVSFLNQLGDIESFTIPTIIAPAPSSKVTDMAKRKQAMTGEQLLHVRVESQALPANETTAYFYVGEYAKDKAGKIEPHADAEQKFNNKLHIVTTLTGLAVAAWRAGKAEVQVPYSGGLPVEEYKNVGPEKVLAQLQGTHVIEALDGAYEGKRVTLTIREGTVHVEGVTSSLALGFTITRGELSELPLGEVIGDDFALGDLGAGTLDLALHTELGFDKNKSTNKRIGTNPYIDAILEEIAQMEAFQEVHRLLEETGEEGQPYRTREEFMRKVVIPGVMEMVAGTDPSDVRFTASWLFVKEVDVTPIVTKGIQAYAAEVTQALHTFWVTSHAEKFVLVGGGLLFVSWNYAPLPRDFCFPNP
ncbi:ParM/StbA family protein [Thalassobacillus pellis]|uniref:ParM/StbA family protein n=1 Tax=Thalassobacillus pellis TaxID=748008 RepID=UPI0019617082|nr:ParM/StbA family protein [Thalassobacillus pellis]MBM7554521.1 plasmid segregation protein ParM [Thalassobacillus pellis]